MEQHQGAKEHLENWSDLEDLQKQKKAARRTQKSKWARSFQDYTETCLNRGPTFQGFFIQSQWMKKGNQTNILSGQKVVKDLHLLRAAQSFLQGV